MLRVAACSLTGALMAALARSGSVLLTGCRGSRQGFIGTNALVEVVREDMGEVAPAPLARTVPFDGADDHAGGAQLCRPDFVSWVRSAAFDFKAVNGQLLISPIEIPQHPIQRDPHVSVSMLDRDDLYRYLEVRSRVIKIEPDPGKGFLDPLAHKSPGLDTYPHEQRRNVERVIVHIQPDHVVA
ncbi:hypothetical protein ACQPXH_12195 [Nocardia sp. CA-135953]|uniref:hypothetical protein n=1 Tax=Nocardia sp. CA-135953 TaxID=3239978 RepID=UPI003D96B0F0